MLLEYLEILPGGTHQVYCFFTFCTWAPHPLVETKGVLKSINVWGTAANVEIVFAAPEADRQPDVIASYITRELQQILLCS